MNKKNATVLIECTNPKAVAVLKQYGECLYELAAALSKVYNVPLIRMNISEGNSGESDIPNLHSLWKQGSLPM